MATITLLTAMTADAAIVIAVTAIVVTATAVTAMNATHVTTIAWSVPTLQISSWLDLNLIIHLQESSPPTRILLKLIAHHLTEYLKE